MNNFKNHLSHENGNITPGKGIIHRTLSKLFSNLKKDSQEITDMENIDTTEQDINEQDINEQDINEQDINEQDINEQDINEQDINEYFPRNFDISGGTHTGKIKFAKVNRDGSVLYVIITPDDGGPDFENSSFMFLNNNHENKNLLAGNIVEYKTDEIAEKIIISRARTMTEEEKKDEFDQTEENFNKRSNPTPIVERIKWIESKITLGDRSNIQFEIFIINNYIDKYGENESLGITRNKINELSNKNRDNFIVSSKEGIVKVVNEKRGFIIVNMSAGPDLVIKNHVSYGLGAMKGDKVHLIPENDRAVLICKDGEIIESEILNS